MTLVRASLIPPSFEHGFGTRAFDPEAFFARRPDLRLYRAHQVHRADPIVVQGDEDPYDVIAEAGDILCTARPRVAVGVVTADCVPILMCSPSRGACATVHAGWRGTVQRAVQVAVSFLGRRFGVNPEEMFVAIGPCICASCYVVGEEVASQIAVLDPDAVTQDPSGALHADLRRCTRTLLQNAGVPNGHIEDVAACTCCDPEGRFHSYRRDKELRGEQLSFIGVPG